MTVGNGIGSQSRLNWSSFDHFQELRAGNLGVRMAATADEVDAAQALRYRVFYEEMGANADAEALVSRRDRDAFDEVADHLLVVDHELGEGATGVVGTYRLIQREAAARIGGFYSASEYDLSRIVGFPGRVLELGRSCVDSVYRGRAVMQLLWRGIAAYVDAQEIDLMFGCASLAGTNPEALAQELTFLYEHHLAPPALRMRALPERYVEMRRMDPAELDVRRAPLLLPPLIKGYMRLGGYVGDGAVIDFEFNTIDVAIVVKSDLVTDKYMKHYERRRSDTQSNAVAGLAQGDHMDIIMTAPRLAAQAVALIEAVGGQLHYMAPYPTAADVAALAAKVNPVAILSRQGPVNGAVMDAAPRLRVIARHGVGVDDVDVAEAVRRGVIVTRAPGSNTRAVSEHAMAMILALVKDLVPLTAQVGCGGWRDAGTKVGDVAGLRLGLVGCGAVGQAVAKLATAFGMQVTGYDPVAGEVDGIERVDRLEALWPRSDVLSLHVPYGPKTRHLVDEVALAMLPAGGYVVNTARGGIIDEAALWEALESGHVAGAGLDVFETEPPALGDRLRGHSRVIATPHVAAATEGSLVAMGVMAAECIVAVLRGGEVPAGRQVGV